MRKLSAISLSLYLILLLLLACTLEGADANMFRGDQLRAGIYDSEVPENSTLIWSFDTGDRIESSPVFYNNKVYVGSEDGRLYCLDAFTGLEIWNFRTGNEVDSTPSIVDDVVYFGSSDMKLYALDAGSGNELWNFSFESTLGQIVSSPSIVGDTVYIGSKDGNLYSINATSNLLKWSFATDGEIFSSPTVDLPYVYIGSLDGRLYCLWAENGTQKWNFSANLTDPEHGFYTTPMISNGVLYMGNEDHNLYSIDAETGTLIWTFTATRNIYSSASISNGVVFTHSLGSPNGFLYALPGMDPDGDGVIEDSEVLWSYDTGDWDGGSSPAIADGKVVVGSHDNHLYCFNESTGDLIWSFTTEDGIVSSPCIVNGIVYISSLDGQVYAIGGSGAENLKVEIIPEFDSLKSDRIMGISFLVTNRGVPVEGAFVTADVSLGNLSQFGASTFPDGTQRIKYTAPLVRENVTVTAHAIATKYGFPDGESEITFTIVSSSAYNRESSQSGFSLAKYGLYLGIIIILIAVNLLILMLRIRKRNEGSNTGKRDTDEQMD